MNLISVIIPLLNDAESLAAQRSRLRALQAEGHEVIIVDGGSRDDSRRVAGEITPKVIDCEPGRALQMNAGADAACGELLLFLHADTRIEPGAIQALLAQREQRGEAFWGRFDVRLDGDHFFYRVIETMMNLRSRSKDPPDGRCGLEPTPAQMCRAGVSEAACRHLNPALGAARDRRHDAAHVALEARLLSRCGPGQAGANVLPPRNRQ
jgi:glycosyltransferase involved in cell wall biosynthesis